MKVYAILDHKASNKTFLDLAEKLRQRGHEVQVDMYFDPAKEAWCDVMWGEYIQGGVVDAFREGFKKPFILRGIDIDLYFGHYMALDYEKTKAVLFINDYIRKWAIQKWESSNDKKLPVPHETVFLGLEPEKWTFKDRSKERGKKVAWLNNIWSGKGVELLCQVAYNVIKRDPEFEFHVTGPVSEPWVIQYFDEFVKRNGLESNIIRQERVNSVDEWLEDKDYILSTSMKECMSMPMAEAMLKGIKPVIHHWWGAAELYPPELVWDSVDQAVESIFSSDYDSASYRKFIEDNYSMDRQVESVEKWLDYALNN